MWNIWCFKDLLDELITHKTRMCNRRIRLIDLDHYRLKCYYFKMFYVKFWMLHLRASRMSPNIKPIHILPASSGRFYSIAITSLFFHCVWYAQDVGLNFLTFWWRAWWVNESDEKRREMAWDVWIDYNGKAPEKGKPSFKGEGVLGLKTSQWKNCVFVCVRESLRKRAVHVIIGQGPDRGQAGQPADRRPERDIYLELQSARLWGGVRYCSRAWQGQEGTRGGDGRRLGSRDRACPWGPGGPEAEGAVGGGRGGIGRFSWGADAQYADV